MVKTTSLFQRIISSRKFSVKQFNGASKMAASRRPSSVTQAISSKTYSDEAMEASKDSAEPKPQLKVTVPAEGESIFKNDSTFHLMKKFLVYKLMGSNLFINHALGMIHLSYKAFGLKLTNFAINNSVASIFTSGETIHSMTRDVDEHLQKNIGGIAGYVVEGLPTMDYEKINAFHEFMMKSIVAKTEGKSEGHFALKFTAIISIDVMTRLSRAQYTFMNDILKYDK